MKGLVNFFRIKLDEEEEKTLVEEIVGSSFGHIAEGMEEIVGYGGLNRLKVQSRNVVQSDFRDYRSFVVVL